MATPLPAPTPRALYQLLNLSPLDIPRCDIARMNLLCAIGLPGAENLNVERYLKQLDDWAAAIEEIIEQHHYQFDEHPEEFEHSEPWASPRMVGAPTGLGQAGLERFGASIA
jgi:hypothetical protein